MARKPQQPNDQGELIQHLKNKQFDQAWDHVKLIGIREMPDQFHRMLIFSKAVKKFDPYANNNFIMYFKQQIYWDLRNQNKVVWDMEDIWPSPTW